jgi:nucleotide-binding universal stress UspA family protein
MAQSTIEPMNEGKKVPARRRDIAQPMRRVLVPADDSRAARCAARHVILQFKAAGAIDIHVLNVQAPLRRSIADFLARPARARFYRDEAERGLRPVLRMLEEAGIPHSVHAKVGRKADVIASVAGELGCDHIVMSTTRRSALARALQSSVTNDVLERTGVPVVVIPAGDASKAERYGVPVGVGTALALLVYAAAD